MDRGHDRLADRFHQRDHFGEMRRLRRLVELGDVGPRDESPARAGEHDRGHGRVVARLRERLHQAEPDLVFQGVDRRIVDEDDGDLVLAAQFYDAQDEIPPTVPVFMSQATGSALDRSAD